MAMAQESTAATTSTTPLKPPQQLPTPPEESHPQLIPTASPTIFVSYGTRSVKARVDREVPLDEIIRQLAQSAQLGIQFKAGQDQEYALRSESGELVTQDNLFAFLERGQSQFSLGSSPATEAREIITKLHSSQSSVVKLAAFSLGTLIKEKSFLQEFLARGGWDALREIIMGGTGGNTLSYTLGSMDNLMELQNRGWEGLDQAFVARIVEIIAKEPLINITRPATAILRRLSLTLPTPPPPASSQPSPLTTSSLPGSGYALIYQEILKQPNFLKLVLARLSSGDVPIAELSLGLINSLARGAVQLGDEDFMDELEGLGAWKAVLGLFDAGKGYDHAGPLSFQAALLDSLNLQLLLPIESEHYSHFDTIWAASGLEAAGDDRLRWRRLGFKTERPQSEFEETGLLGLKVLTRFASDHKDEFAAIIKDQQTRPITRQCPLARVSSTVLLALLSHFALPPPQPLLLKLYECHHMVVGFFVRIWAESGAEGADYERVASLMKSEVRSVLKADKDWEAVYLEFSNARYRVVRDRQMKEMEEEDNFQNKVSIQNLRARLHRQSLEFVRHQRIACLYEGNWLRVVSPATPMSKKGETKPVYRFYRLSSNMKVLHFVESTEQGIIRAGLEDLPERLDLSLITDIIATNSLPAALTTPRTRTRTASSSLLPSILLSAPPPAPPTGPVSPLSFTLLSHSSPLITLSAPSSSVLAEWMDGISILTSPSPVYSKDMLDMVETLTEIGVKVKLLDLSGDGVEIPESVEVGEAPRSVDFWYASM